MRIGMTINDAHVPAERFELFIERFVATYVARSAGDLERVVIDNGNETEWNKASQRQPDFIAKDMVEAAHIITVGAVHELPLQDESLRE